MYKQGLMVGVVAERWRKGTERSEIKPVHRNTIPLCPHFTGVRKCGENSHDLAPCFLSCASQLVSGLAAVRPVVFGIPELRERNEKETNTLSL